MKKLYECVSHVKNVKKKELFETRKHIVKKERKETLKYLRRPNIVRHKISTI
jgi:hypothetical protein